MERATKERTRTTAIHPKEDDDAIFLHGQGYGVYDRERPTPQFELFLRVRNALVKKGLEHAKLVTQGFR